MEANERLKKNVSRLWQQFGEKIGAGQPTKEHLEMYSLTLEGYHDGLILLAADLEEKQKQIKLAQEAADKEKLKGSGSLLDLSAGTDNRPSGAEKAHEAAPPLAVGRLQASSKDLAAIKAEKDDEEMFGVQNYVLQAAESNRVLPSIEEIGMYTLNHKLAELQRL